MKNTVMKFVNWFQRYIAVIYVILLFLIFFPWKMPERKGNGEMIITIMMFICNLIAAFFAIEDILDKLLKLILLKCERLSKIEVFAIIANKKETKGKESIYEIKYNYVKKFKFSSWIFLNVIIIFACALYSGIAFSNGGQFLNLYTYVNFLLFLYGFTLGNKIDKRVDILLDKGKNRSTHS